MWQILFDKQRRLNRWMKATKRVRRAFRGPTGSVPVFIFGKQRSGTTMVMQALNLHPDTEIFEEAKNSRAFLDGRIRSFETVRELVTRSKAPFVCFKPLADSHLIGEFRRHFPTGRFLWVYRDYRATAASSIKEFANATVAIRKICSGETGGGWLQQGVSAESLRTLQRVYTTRLTELDLACLVWWVRNRIAVEQELQRAPNVHLCRYEEMVIHPQQGFAAVFDFVGLRRFEKAYRNVHAKAVAGRASIDVHPEVKQLCEELTRELVGQ